MQAQSSQGAAGVHRCLVDAEVGAPTPCKLEGCSGLMLVCPNPEWPWILLQGRASENAFWEAWVYLASLQEFCHHQTSQSRWTTLSTLQRAC